MYMYRSHMYGMYQCIDKSPKGDTMTTSDDTGLRAARGILIGIVLGLISWGVILGTMYLYLVVYR